MSDEEAKPTKPGIVYLENLPNGIKPLSIRQLMQSHGQVGRIFLKKYAGDDDLVKNTPNVYKEGWVEFLDHKIAKRVAKSLNGMNMGKKKRHKYYDHFWSIKYLPGTEWSAINTRRGLEPGSLSMNKGTEMMKTKKQVQCYLEKADRTRLLNKIRSARNMSKADGKLESKDQKINEDLKLKGIDRMKIKNIKDKRSHIPDAQNTATHIHKQGKQVFSSIINQIFR